MPGIRRRIWRNGAQRRQADLCRQSNVAAPDREEPALFLSPGRHLRRRGDDRTLRRVRPGGVLHLAAESHVDRAIDGAGPVHPDQCRGHLCAARGGARALAASAGRAGAGRFRFHHVSTDEVFGSLGSGRQIHRDDAVRAEFALFGLKGGFRPSGARLATRPTDCRRWSATLRTITAPTISRKS